MQFNRVSRVLLITSVLAISSLIPAFSSTVSAESFGETTTFYFKDILGFEDFYGDDGYGFFGITSVSQTPPTKQNDSRYPPSLLKKNASKIIPELNSEEWLYWFTTSWLLYFFEDSEEFNLTEELFNELRELFDEEELEDIDLDLFMDLMIPNPFRVIETYEYTGNETLEINGDVVFDLFFSAPYHILPKFKDQVEIGLYSMNMESLFPLPKLLKNRTEEIKRPIRRLLQKINEQEITLENISYLIQPGESILFSIKLLPSEKRFSQLAEKERKIVKWLAECMLNRFIEKFENNSKKPLRQQIVELYKEVSLITEDFNITKEDIAEILESLNAFSSCLVYDSAMHPSSVIVPLEIPQEDENEVLYYLHTENIMDTTSPSDEGTYYSLAADYELWQAPLLDRNKIINEVSASLYFQYLKFINPGKIKIATALFDGDIQITTPVVKELDSSNRLGQAPLTFSFEDINYELFHDHSLTVGIGLANNSKTWLRKMKLLYDSNEHPSFVQVLYQETDNIQTNVKATPENSKIIPGKTVEYILNISSMYDDEIQINTFIASKQGEWEVTTEPEVVTLSAGESHEAHISVESTNNKHEAYGDSIELNIEIEGKTGIVKTSLLAQVSEEAIEYNVAIIGYTESKNIKKGENKTFYFVIENRNTGAVDDVDSYTITATSENNWELIYTKKITELTIGEKTDPEAIFVRVSVPKNTSKSSDTITFTVTSESNSDAVATVEVTVIVIGPTLLESIYEFFESTSKSLGLDDIFGSLAPIALVALIMIMLLFLIIIITLVLTRKVVQIVCTDRIKEIDPNEEATFPLIIRNPTKKPKTYQLITKTSPLTTKWEIYPKNETIVIEGRQSKPIELQVKPTDEIQPNDWIEVKASINIVGKRKTEEISLMAMVKEGKPILQIRDVFTWPKDFRKGDRVITSFKLKNKGTLSARNVQVLLYINGREKNKLQVTIPSGGHADIRMPWIALKGKHDLRIKTSEQ
jgi:hypothetical protein